jgi:hypothetical protein
VQSAENRYSVLIFRKGGAILPLNQHTNITTSQQGGDEKVWHDFTSDKSQEDKRITMNVSLYESERTFLKIYAAKHGTNVSDLIHQYVEMLKAQEKAEAVVPEP